MFLRKYGQTGDSVRPLGRSLSVHRAQHSDSASDGRRHGVCNEREGNASLEEKECCNAKKEEVKAAEPKLSKGEIVARWTIR